MMIWDDNNSFVLSIYLSLWNVVWHHKWMHVACVGKKNQIFMEINTSDIGRINKKEWCNSAMCCYISILKTLNKISNDV
jgi:hypothetical protein